MNQALGNRRHFSKSQDEIVRSLTNKELYEALRDEALRMDPASLPPDAGLRHPATREFVERVVLLSVVAIKDWETWALALRPSPRRAFHSDLIKVAKGATKAIRILLSKHS